jgi:hypothetical protein
VELVALVPNLKGVQRAAKCGVAEVSYVISVSAAHNKANINRTHEESLADLAAIVEACPSVSVNLSMSTVFGCPFDGEVPVEKTLWLIGETLKRGAKTYSLCDTIGVANPLQVQAVVRAVRERYPDLKEAEARRGFGPARYYGAKGLKGFIGVIDAISGGFCDKCNRVRLTSDGFLKTCLCYDIGADLKTPLRGGCSREELCGAIRLAISQKPEQRGFYGAAPQRERRKMSQIGG